MKLIVILLSGLLTSPQSFIEAGTVLRGQTQATHVLPMLIYFSSDHCTECEKFDALFEQPEMLQRMEQQYVSVRVSIDDLDGRACADIYQIATVPAFVIADHKGVILYKSDESLSVTDIQLLLENVPGKYSTVNQPEEKFAEDNPAMYAVNMLSEDQSSGTVSSSPVEESVVNFQHAESIPVDHGEELKSAQIKQVTTAIEETPSTIQKTPVVNESPSSIESNDKSEVSEKSNDVDTKPAVTKSSPSTVSAAKHVTAKAAVRIQKSYSIQLGYFTEAVNSNKLVQRAKAKGLAETRTQTETREGKSCYRVLIGDFKTLAEAQAQLAEVHALGLKGAVHRQ